MLLLDQYSKRMVQRHVAHRGVALGPVLRIRHFPHRTSAYRRHGTRVVLVISWVVALIAAFLLYHSGRWFQPSSALLGLGLALGGAAGNLLDILRWRCVIDFIDLRWWPVFNLADVAIVAGLVLAFWP